MSSEHESRNKLTITIDGEPFTTRDDDQEAAAGGDHGNAEAFYGEVQAVSPCR